MYLYANIEYITVLKNVARFLVAIIAINKLEET